jgi:acyl dehydratase
LERKKYGDDFKVGETFKTRAITVTESHLVTWAGLTMDFYPIHTDKEFAAQSDFGERIAHGPLIFGLAIGLVGLSGYAEDSVIAWLGVNNMKMLKPVKIGDTIHVEIEVISKKPTKNPARGILTWHFSVVNQRGEKVLILDYLMMFHMRG